MSEQVETSVANIAAAVSARMEFEKGAFRLTTLTSESRILEATATLWHTWDKQETACLPGEEFRVSLVHQVKTSITRLGCHHYDYAVTFRAYLSRKEGEKITPVMEKIFDLNNNFKTFDETEQQKLADLLHQAVGWANSARP